MNSEAIFKVLDELGKRIAGPAEQVWQIYLKQTIVFGIADIACGVGLLLLSLGLFGLCKKITNKDEDGEYSFDRYCDDGDRVVAQCFLWTGITILAMWGGALMAYGTMYIANPSYWIIQDLASTVIK